MKPEVKKLIIANLPYLLFVYLFGKLGQAYRLAEGIDLSQKLLHFADGCAAAFESAAPSFHLFDLLIGVAGAAGVEPDPGFRQGHLGAGADTAADQAVYLLICQEAGQRTMAAAVGVHDLRGDHLASLYIIELELLCMAEMLKNRSVLISHCNFHVHASFLLLRGIRRRIRRSPAPPAGDRAYSFPRRWSEAAPPPKRPRASDGPGHRSAVPWCGQLPSGQRQIPG